MFCKNKVKPSQALTINESRKSGFDLLKANVLQNKVKSSQALTINESN